jgi:hypothetical protein
MQRGSARKVGEVAHVEKNVERIPAQVLTSMWTSCMDVLVSAAKNQWQALLSSHSNLILIRGLVDVVQWLPHVQKRDQ